MPHTWIWESPDWPEFRWDAVRLAPWLSRARLAQGIGRERVYFIAPSRKVMLRSSLSLCEVYPDG